MGKHKCENFIDTIEVGKYTKNICTKCKKVFRSTLTPPKTPTTSTPKSSPDGDNE